MAVAVDRQFPVAIDAWLENAARKTITRTRLPKVQRRRKQNIDCETILAGQHALLPLSLTLS